MSSSRAIYLLSVFSGISSLVYLNASIPSLLAFRLHLAPQKAASQAGTLLLVDELLALPSVVVWGHLLDRWPVQIAALAHFLLAIGLVAHSYGQRTFPDLLLARLVFSLGASAATTSITGLLPLLSDSSTCASSSDETENAPLLDSIAVEPKTQKVTARLAGLVGLASGTGALLSVFIWLRIPSWLSLHYNIRLDQGLQYTYRLVAVLALFSALLLFSSLQVQHKADTPATTDESSWQLQIRNALKGFRLAWRHPDLFLAYIAGFIARAQPVSVTLFVPILVNAFYINSGLCKLHSPTEGSEAIKENCRSAFALASSLTGTVQLVSLLLSVPVGWLAARSSTRKSGPRLLAMSLFAGALGFASFALLPNGDPRKLGIVVPAAILMGISQIFGIILAMTLATRARAVLQQKGEGDLAGSIAGCQAFFGGVAVLLVSKSGSWLSALSSQTSIVTAPFFLVCGINIIAAICALVISWKTPS